MLNGLRYWRGPPFCSLPLLPLAFALALVALSPTPAAARDSARAPPSSDDHAAAIGRDATPLPNGLYAVPVPGGTLTTHGPDPLTRRSETRATTFGFGLGDAERPPACGSDYYQHVIYARPSGAPDRYAKVLPTILSSIRRMNAVLNRDAFESGGASADYKLLCDAAGEIRVDSLVTSGSDFQSIATSAQLAGFASTNADYTIFFDGNAGYCGIASYQADERLLMTNPNNNGGGYAITYRDCWLTETPMHENGHNQGAVQYLAPNSTGTGGHCYDEFDVMCYSPDGGDRHQGGAVLRCDERVYFDCGYDDYFNTSPPPGSYLATNWNIGSPLNRFIAFGPDEPSGGGGGDEGGGGDTGSADPRVARTPRLRKGRALRRRAARAGRWRYFVTRVPRNTRVLRVSFTQRGCRTARCPSNLDLYLLRGSLPTVERFDCSSARRGRRERCRMRVPLRGRWYVGVHTASGRNGAFAIRAAVAK